MLSLRYKPLLLILFAINSCFIHNNADGKGDEPAGDTIVLVKKGEAYTLDSKAPVIQVSIPIPAGLEKRGEKFFLKLKDASLKEAPDGIYEIYITAGKVSKEKLDTQNPGFVDVVDTYALNSNPDKKDTRVDISRIVKRFSGKSGLSNLYLTMRYRGNRLPDGRESANAGNLSFGSVSVEMLR